MPLVYHFAGADKVYLNEELRFTFDLEKAHKFTYKRANELVEICDEQYYPDMKFYLEQVQGNL